MQNIPLFYLTQPRSYHGSRIFIALCRHVHCLNWDCWPTRISFFPCPLFSIKTIDRNFLVKLVIDSAFLDDSIEFQADPVPEGFSCMYQFCVQGVQPTRSESFAELQCCAASIPCSTLIEEIALENEPSRRLRFGILFPIAFLFYIRRKDPFLLRLFIIIKENTSQPPLWQHEDENIAYCEQMREEHPAAAAVESTAAVLVGFSTSFFTWLLTTHREPQDAVMIVDQVSRKSKLRTECISLYR